MKKQRVLHKFKGDKDCDYYFDLDEIVGVMERKVDPTDSYQSFSDKIQTILVFESGAQYGICEHITEIIALMEGRDVRPSQILYGKNTNR